MEHTKSQNNLKTLSLTVTLLSGNVQKIKGYEKILAFFTTEFEFWENSPENKDGFSALRAHFLNCINRLKEFEQSSSTLSGEEFENKWKILCKEVLCTKSTHNYKIRPIFSSDYPLLRQLVNSTSEEQQRDMFEGVLDYTLRANIDASNLMRNKIRFLGFLKAHDFLVQKQSIFDELKITNSQTLSQLQSTWIEKTSHLEDEYKNFKDSRNSELDTVRNEFLSWVSENKTSTEQFNEVSKSKIETLESTYDDKLKLSAPVKYWQERARKYKKQGQFWLVFLSGATLGLIFFLVKILYTPPFVFSKKLAFEDPSGIKGLIITISIVSFGAYLVSILSRLTFSSFHLERDADEREQLTHIYLALKEKNAIEESERSIVLQALFSRVETGLLGENGSPTMPLDTLLSYTKKSGKGVS